MKVDRDQSRCVSDLPEVIELEHRKFKRGGRNYRTFRAPSGLIGTKGSRRNKFTFWRERRAGRCEAPRRSRCRTSSRIPSFARDAPLSREAGQARWLCCSLLTYHTGYSSSLAPRQRAWGPAAKCEFISVRALSTRRIAKAALLVNSTFAACRWPLVFS